ncbi:MAG TPA: S8 family serine peptidase [bacterium]|nr:S8 family serine peptidase [bacterium]
MRQQFVFLVVILVCSFTYADLKVGKTLSAVLNDKSVAYEQEIGVMFFQNYPYAEELPVEASLDFNEAGVISNITLNGIAATQEEYALIEEQRILEHKQNMAYYGSYHEKNWKRFLEKLGYAESSIKELIKGSRSSLFLRLPKEKILDIISNEEIVKGISTAIIPPSRKDISSNYLLATNIDPWAIDYGREGNNIGIYQNESACPTEYYGIYPYYIYRYKYMRLPQGTGVSNHSLQVLNILKEASPESYVYCYGNPSNETSLVPNNDWLDGVEGNPPIYITSGSWIEAYSDWYNDYSDFMNDWDQFVYSQKIAAFFGAGNSADNDWCESPVNCDHLMDDYYVGSPGRAYNVITVGAYDDSIVINGRYQMADFSSFRNGLVEKPEISAPGVDILGTGTGYSGTSFATPHAAALAADLMGSYTWLKYRPHLLKAAMIASATDLVSRYYSAYGNIDQVGFGGIDFRSIYYEGTYHYWEGAYSNWSTWDGNGDGRVEHSFTVAANKKVSVVIAWLNNPANNTMTGSDLNIGINFDLEIICPGGSTPCMGSNSTTNTFEVYTFNVGTPNTGTYKARIRKLSATDTTSPIYLGLWVNMDSI